ncbi:MAG: undecaprenyldiphospho-muramoylpentapeptide beta-N-acetylglucosaminyltransferase [Actinomycetota bacterium]|nr:undecaprenyldiphospho-muramoylpentapeptide beta-N-acetylglucosaminyltransferase [Actinomycetota bacterium]
MICGGGTAGHVYPGLALAEALKAADSDTEVIFVGSERGLESKVVPQNGYVLETLPVRGLPRRLSLNTLSFAAGLSFSLAKAARLLKKYRPAAIIGMGGFAGFPMVLVGARLGYPTLIHEQNAVPGLANRWLSRRVDLVALTYNDHLDMIKGAKVVKVIGNPVREAVLKAKRPTALKVLGLDDGRITVLVFGGSRGAQKINQAVIGAYDSFRRAHNLQIIHIPGMIEYDAIKQQLDGLRQPHDNVKYHLFPYVEEMGLAYAAADLVVSRAGAGTLAEVTGRGLPSILVPYPYATDNHQAANAKWLESAGAAKVIPDDNFNDRLFWQAISSFLYHPATLDEMADRSKRLGHPKAARKLASLVLKAAANGKKSQRDT